MEIDLINTQIEIKDVKPGEIEEVFEDPFAVKFMPDSDYDRYFIIGQTVAQRLIFVCFNTDGKKAKIISVRETSEEESMFYKRNYSRYQ
ncbi:BrnT family toxin [Akkermansiaceae bacterium]|nr:BrnT family toxin [Akkermansiaceae bacterium]